MARRCCRCNLESAWDEAFFIKGWKAKAYCPGCWKVASEKETCLLIAITALVLFLVYVVLPFLLPLWFGGPGMAFWTRLPVFCMWVSLFMILRIIWHECAHAVCAAMLGLRVFKIEFGSRWRIGRIKFRNVILEFGWLPSGGLTYVGHPSTHRLRLKHFLMVLAAPLLDAVLLACCWWIWESRFTLGWPDGPWLTALIALALVLLSALVGGLLPIPNGFTADKHVVNDGSKLRAIPFWTQQRIEDIHASYFMGEARAASENRQFQRAVEWCEQGLKLYPRHVLLHLMMGSCCLFTREFIRARGHLLPLLESEIQDRSLKLQVLNTAAVADLLMDDNFPTGQQDEFFKKDGIENPLTEAHAFSEEAFRTAPWVTAYKDTYGCVLIAMSRGAEGQPLVEQAMNTQPLPLSKAFCAVFSRPCGSQSGASGEEQTILGTGPAVWTQSASLCRRSHRNYRSPASLPERALVLRRRRGSQGDTVERDVAAGTEVMGARKKRRMGRT